MEKLSKEEKANIKAQKKAVKRERLKSRITEIDMLRGIAILLMVMDHIFYDLGFFMESFFTDYPDKFAFTAKLYDAAQFYWFNSWRVGVRYFVVFLFLALTGISCSFSRSNLKRGVKLLIFGLALTLVTYLLGVYMEDKDAVILFNIIHSIALSIICVWLIELITSNKWVFLALGVIFTGVGAYIYFVNPGCKYVRFGSMPFFELLFKQMIGMVEVGADNASFLFSGGQVFIGVFLGKLLYKERKSLIFKGDYKNNFLTFVGRNTLIIYLAHQVILPVIIGLILLIAGFKLAI